METTFRSMHRALAVVALLLVSALAGCRRGGSPEVADGMPAPGTEMPNVLREARLRFAPVDAPAPAKGWVLYSFGPGSPGSEANSAPVEALARSLPAGWTLLSLATDARAVPAYLERTQSTVPLLTQVPAGTQARYGIDDRPRIYILGPKWTLIEALSGELRGETLKQLAQRFELPPASLAGTSDGAAAPKPPQQGETAARDLPGTLCHDTARGVYSRGSKAEVLGEAFRCGEGGLWLPAG